MMMKRKQKGMLSLFLGVILFIIGLFVTLPVEEYYLASLFILFFRCAPARRFRLFRFGNRGFRLCGWFELIKVQFE